MEGRVQRGRVVRVLLCQESVLFHGFYLQGASQFHYANEGSFVLRCLFSTENLSFLQVSEDPLTVKVDHLKVCLYLLLPRYIFSLN